ncbi:homeobox and leucine zipper encoding b [Archocentrus centrarchus]|uniref:homeobox and leucine zipper encoding b n=1 Tax=Archocentrus centrarchus TaxID=63155 RepID=UPI0011E9B986|nr:uncharacterized protein LOC115796828 [Archocentrus centrarchus]
MSKMRHFADEGLHGLGQKPSSAREETRAFSDMNATPMTLSMNQSGVVCLPLVSENRKLVWVHSHQINLQVNGAAELDEAFDRFPYLTQRQTTELAERCSLHPDQVRAWFMVQRLRYGISWDYKDIYEVRSKFNSSQTVAPEKKELQNESEGEVMEDGREKREKQKRRVRGFGGSAKEMGVRGESVKVNEPLEREIKEKQPVKEDKKEEKSNMRKRKRTTVKEKMGKKRVKQDKEEMIEGAGRVEARIEEVESEVQKCTKSEEMPFSRKKRNAGVNKSLKSIQEECDAPLALSSLLDLQSESQMFGASLVLDIDLLQRAGDPCSTANTEFVVQKEKEAGDLHAETDQSVAITYTDKPKDLIQIKNSPTSADDPPAPAQSTPPIRLRCKTPNQLAMLKMAFLHCQYPDKEQYGQLARLIGISRLALVQWFSDMRYFIKRGRPRWMNQEQHSQVLASVKYRQYMTAMVKVNSAKSVNSCVMNLKGEEATARRKM